MAAFAYTQNPCSPVAQLVEQAAVNRWVAGSSPARGAIFSPVISMLLLAMRRALPDDVRHERNRPDIDHHLPRMRPEDHAGNAHRCLPVVLGLSALQCGSAPRAGRLLRVLHIWRRALPAGAGKRQELLRVMRNIGPGMGLRPDGLIRAGRGVSVSLVSRG